MTSASPMRREAFLAWEECQELRYEFDGVRVIPRAGGSRAHAAIQSNLAICIGNALRGQPCEFFGSNLKVDTGRGYRYPDGFAVCTPGPGSSTVVADPVVIFEVWGPDTVGEDLITKNLEYAAIPSVRRYVMLAQDRIGALVFARAGGDWIGRVFSGAAMLHLPEIGVEIPLPELYDGLDFEA